MGMYYDGDNYVGDQPSDIPDTSKKDKKKKKKNKKKNGDEDKTTGKDIVDAAGKALGQLSADHKASWSGLKGGTTDVVMNNKTLARGPSDVLSPEERKRLEKLTSGYGSNTIA